MIEVRKIVADMILQGIVEVTKVKPVCVSPLGLVSRMQDDGSTKLRLVWDASRHVNKFVEHKHVKLSHLEKALQITKPGDWQGIFDLKSAYYHIKIDASQHKFLGAAITNSDGSKLYFQYKVLPFGLSSAVHAITKLWKPISSYLNLKGIRNTIYIDDGRILEDSKDKLEASRIETYQVITKAGWALEVDKSDKENEGSQVKKYLGFEIDTKEMMILAPAKKLSKVHKAVNKLLNQKTCFIKELAQTAGLIASLEPSHENLARVASRSSYAQIAAGVDSQGWKGTIILEESTQKEIKFFLDNMYNLNGSPIKSVLTEIRLETIIENPVAKRFNIDNHNRGQSIFVSDSSEVKAFTYELTNNHKTTNILNFTDEQKRWSSSARELLAVLNTFRQFQKQGNVTGRRIYWCSDSENAVRFIAKGSRNPTIQAMAFEIAQIAQKLRISIKPIHLSRQDPRMVEADEGSKTLDTDNWSIDEQSFQELNAQLEFDTDLFADQNNRRVEKFCSLYYCEATEAVDAFSTTWGTLGKLWLCPPVSALSDVFHRIMATPCEGIVCLPVWEASNFYSLYFKKNHEVREPFVLMKLWKPFIVQNEGARNTALFGTTPFYFAALYFNKK